MDRPPACDAEHITRETAALQFTLAFRKLLKGVRNLVFVGIGNEYRTDDGAGIKLLRLLREDELLGSREDLRFFDTGTTLINHVDVIAALKTDAIILLDFVSFSGEGVMEGAVPPFAFYSLETGEGRNFSSQTLSTHQLPLDFLRGFLDHFSPGTKLFLIAMKGCSTEHCEKLTLTTEVEASVHQLHELVKKRLLFHPPVDQRLFFPLEK